MIIEPKIIDKHLPLVTWEFQRAAEDQPQDVSSVSS